MSGMPICYPIPGEILATRYRGRGVGSETPTAHDGLVYLDSHGIRVIHDTNHLVSVTRELRYQEEGTDGGEPIDHDTWDEI